MPVTLVGRTRERAELAAAWAQAADGATGPQVAVLTGDPGTGKSALVAAALADLDPAPVTVLHGQARIHSPAPYDWLAAVLSGRDTRGLPAPGPALAWLAQHDAAPVERFAPGALLRVATRVVRALAGTGPAVLVVEDLHALDPASLNLVADLAAAPGLPALLLVTSRPSADPLVARTLARLAGTPGAVRQHLGPLRPADVAEVLAQVYPGLDIGAGAAREVWDRTAGNAYRLTELIATTAADDVATLLREPADGGPDLTAREAEVLVCLRDGMANKQIARALGISVRTVTVHVSNLLRKTGTASRTEAALWAVRHTDRTPSLTPRSQP
ncbi:regulatory protein, luxR family [Asanoa hainanensis]|uniref:Regulatory protein, luxR family n=1 Tax=Asanoa hainanensis TaxID=560556 RepID=A0A239NSL7_9ACTN|nr:AAA family ATPase [Asanoa hainanensis]SNT57433.1 regulatory protein, luxR family [Asanoa hainanensis]